MLSLPKLVDCDGTPRATLDKGELGMDGVLDGGEITSEQRMHVQRLGRGTYVVWAVADGTIPAFRRVFGKTRWKVDSRREPVGFGVDVFMNRDLSL